MPLAASSAAVSAWKAGADEQSAWRTPRDDSAASRTTPHSSLARPERRAPYSVDEPRLNGTVATPAQQSSSRRGGNRDEVVSAWGKPPRSNGEDWAAQTAARKSRQPAASDGDWRRPAPDAPRSQSDTTVNRSMPAEASETRYALCVVPRYTTAHDLHMYGHAGCIAMRTCPSKHASASAAAAHAGGLASTQCTKVVAKPTRMAGRCRPAAQTLPLATRRTTLRPRGSRRARSGPRRAPCRCGSHVAAQS